MRARKEHVSLRSARAFFEQNISVLNVKRRREVTRTSGPTSATSVCVSSKQCRQQPGSARSNAARKAKCGRRSSRLRHTHASRRAREDRAPATSPPPPPGALGVWCRRAVRSAFGGVPGRRQGADSSCPAGRSARAPSWVPLIASLRLRGAELCGQGRTRGCRELEDAAALSWHREAKGERRVERTGQ